MLTIDAICKERGSISEDGDAWTDKYSGYVIKQIDMDTDEGYDAAGYKLQTRSVIEKSIGETLIQSPCFPMNIIGLMLSERHGSFRPTPLILSVVKK